jgi:hypothetical protein
VNKYGMQIFDLAHIFIVFHPGSGGNFIASTIEKILTNQDDSIIVTEQGNAHSKMDRKITGTDYLSLGTEVAEQSNFSTQEERIGYYLSKIKTEYNNVTTPQIVWSHDFTNIPLYKKIFPNSKTIVISQQSNREKLAIVLLHVIKNILDTNVVNPVTNTRMEQINKLWDYAVNAELINLVGPDKIKNVKKDSKLMMYVSFKKMLQYYGLSHIVEDTERQLDVVNYVLYPVITPSPDKLPYTLGNAYKTYTSGSVVLPYSYIMDNKPELLVDAINQAIPLSDKQKEVILNNYNYYRDAQVQDILTDPIKYYTTIKHAGLSET